MTGDDTRKSPGAGKDPKAAAKARREERLAEALRANLKRRKAAGSKKPTGAAGDPKKP